MVSKCFGGGETAASNGVLRGLKTVNSATRNIWTTGLLDFPELSMNFSIWEAESPHGTFNSMNLNKIKMGELLVTSAQRPNRFPLCFIIFTI